MPSVAEHLKAKIPSIAGTVLGAVAFYFVFQRLLPFIDPQVAARQQSKKKAEKIKEKLGWRKDMELDEWEEVIATEVIAPEDINVTFDDIGGLDDIVASLRESVIYPLTFPELFQTTSASSALSAAPKGVLLYGPPGCGKTMLGRALAKESGATFINVHISTLTNKWFGESNKLVKALFGLANKVQPAIIFIDEIDAFLKMRGGEGEHEAMGMIKAEFMTLWDGLLSSTTDSRIIVLGATNRPNDIDAAILRRMPKRFAVRLPDAAQREKILRLLLEDTKLDPSLSFSVITSRTAGLSGSDIKELCRNAVLAPIRDFVRQNSDTGVGARGMDIEHLRKSMANGKVELRGLRTEDVLGGLGEMSVLGDSGYGLSEMSELVEEMD
ncbi:mitochondrial dynamin GTPase Msp1 [Saitoella coloradoensis]